MKLDLHVHSHYSKCSILSLDQIRKLFSKKEIIPIITDHNTIRGALRFKSKIIGEEIRAKEGEITGLFLNEEIEPFLSIEETIDKIREQDGLVYLPHPFDPFREGVAYKKADIVEVFNSRCINNGSNKKALDFANKHNLIKAVGSDAHTPLEVGNAYVIMEDFNDKNEFLKNLKEAEFFTKRGNIFLTHGMTKIIKMFH